MPVLSRLAAAPALVVRVLVAVAGLVCFAAGLVAYLGGRAPAGENLPLSAVALIAAAALGRRFGIPLPGNGFSSYVTGVMLYAILDRGWAFAAVIAPFAMLIGDLLLRRVPPRAALGNAAHLTTGCTLVGLLYGRLGGETGAAALSAANLGPLAAAIVLLPIVVNGTFYLDLALGQAIAWVDARLTLRWEAVVSLVSAALALAWFALAHGGLASGPAAALAAALAVATGGSVYVIRLGVHADELGLIQRPAHAPDGVVGGHRRGVGRDLSLRRRRRADRGSGAAAPRHRRAQPRPGPG